MLQEGGKEIEEKICFSVFEDGHQKIFKKSKWNEKTICLWRRWFITLGKKLPYAIFCRVIPCCPICLLTFKLDNPTNAQ